MRFAFLFRSVAALTVVALAACAGQNAVPSAGPGFSPYATAASPCNISGIWYFAGACAKKQMPSGGATYRLLPVFDGIRLYIQFPQNNAPKNDTFVIGAGTSDANITGTFDGIAFPLYGSKGYPCYRYNTTTKTPCVGKGLVYAAIVNKGKAAVTFQKTPSVTIIASKFYGTKCTLDQLVDNGNGVILGWEITPLSAAPSRKKLVIPSASIPLVIAQGQKFYTFAISCK